MYFHTWYFILSFPYNRIWDKDLHAGGLLGMWFQEAGVRDKGNDPGKEEKPTEQCVIELATTKGDWYSIIKDILQSLWNTFYNQSHRGQRKKYLFINSHVPLLWCVNFPTLLVCTCVSECRKDLCNVHAAISGKPQSKKLESGVRQGPFRMHMLKLSKCYSNHWSKMWAERIWSGALEVSHTQSCHHYRAWYSTSAPWTFSAR